MCVWGWGVGVGGMIFELHDAVLWGGGGFGRRGGGGGANDPACAALHVTEEVTE